jgi:hypothetical protein
MASAFLTISDMHCISAYLYPRFHLYGGLNQIQKQHILRYYFVQLRAYDSIMF